MYNTRFFLIILVYISTIYSSTTSQFGLGSSTQRNGHNVIEFGLPLCVCVRGAHVEKVQQPTNWQL